jgi:hypothetical protein
LIKTFWQQNKIICKIKWLRSIQIRLYVNFTFIFWYKAYFKAELIICDPSLCAKENLRELQTAYCPRTCSRCLER